MVRYKELLGLPGAGKSSYCKKVASNLKFIEADTDGNIIRLLKCILYSLLNMKAFFLVIRSLFYVRFNDILDQFKSIVRLQARLWDLRFNNCHNAIYDEGKAQALWGVFMMVERSKKTEAVFNSLFISVFNGNEHITFLDVAIDVVIARNITRNKPNRFEAIIRSKDISKLNVAVGWMELLNQKLTAANLIWKVIR